MTIDSGGIRAALSRPNGSMSEDGGPHFVPNRQGQGRVFILGAFAVSMLCLPTTGQSQTLTKRQLQTVYSSHLSREGYRPEITRSGNVSFKREGGTYYIYINETVPWFFRMDMFRVFLSNDKSPDTQRRRREATNFATSGTRAVKVYLSETSNNIVFSVQVYQDTPGDANQWLDRMFSAIGSARSKYLEHFNRERPPGSPN